MTAQNQVYRAPTFITVIGIIACVPILFYETTEAMVKVWLVNETFTHGFLIFPISLWLIWQKRSRISQTPLNPEPWMIMLSVPVLTAWFISYIVDVQVVQQLAIIALIPVLILILAGRKTLLTILFPLLYLFFAVPLGQGLIPGMMEFTADFTVFMIQLVGVPIYRDGLYFTLPSGNWSVVEECSGVRYLIASLALGTVYSYISYSSYRKRLIFILFAIAVPILANGIRAFGIVMTGHLSGMKLATGVDHLLYGWIFFGLVIFLMFFIGSYWADPVSLSNQEPAPASMGSTFRPGYFLKTVSIILGLTISTLVIANQLKNSSVDIPSNLQLSLPNEINGWKSTRQNSINWNPEFTNPDVESSKIYQSNGDSVQIDVAYYYHQRQGAEAVSSLNRLTNPHGGAWKIIHSTKLIVQDIEVSESILRKNNERLLVWHWYRIGAMRTANPYMAKLFDVYNQLVNWRNDASMISLSTKINGTTVSSRKKLTAFINDEDTMLMSVINY